jgi:hypothetical protein
LEQKIIKKKGNKMRENKIINATPHPINETETGIEFPASGLVVRVASSSELATEIVMGNKIIQAYRTTFGEVEGLPEQQIGIFYIVSGLVLSASTRTDLLAPGELVRDENGRAIGCKGFRTN